MECRAEVCRLQYGDTVIVTDRVLVPENLTTIQIRLDYPDMSMAAVLSTPIYGIQSVPSYCRCQFPFSPQGIINF